MRLGFGMCMTNVKYFEDPREFKPDRFNLPLEHPHAFTPFSGGARNCIGQHMSMMEVRITLVDVLKKYKLERTKTHFQVKLTSFMNRPVSPYLVRFIAKSVEVNS
jgi:cytochrome P450